MKTLIICLVIVCVYEQTQLKSKMKQFQMGMKMLTKFLTEDNSNLKEKGAIFDETGVDGLDGESLSPMKNEKYKQKAKSAAILYCRSIGKEELQPYGVDNDMELENNPDWKSFVVLMMNNRGDHELMKTCIQKKDNNEEGGQIAFVINQSDNCESRFGLVEQTNYEKMQLTMNKQQKQKMFQKVMSDQEKKLSESRIVTADMTEESLLKDEEERKKKNQAEKQNTLKMLEGIKNGTKSDDDEIDPYEVLEKARQGVDIEDIKKKLKIKEDEDEKNNKKSNKTNSNDQKQSKKEEKSEQTKDQSGNSDQFKLIQEQMKQLQQQLAVLKPSQPTNNIQNNSSSSSFSNHTNEQKEMRFIEQQKTQINTVQNPSLELLNQMESKMEKKIKENSDEDRKYMTKQIEILQRQIDGLYDKLKK